MPQTKKKPAAKSRAAAARRTPPPKRRELLAVLMLILGIFSFIGFFSASGAFIGFFTGLVKGLVGPGFFALAPVLLLCAAILCFHRGRPVRLRVLCSLLLPVIAGALWHLLVCNPPYEISFNRIAELWQDGRGLAAGGAVSGTITETFALLFNKAGAFVVLLLLVLFLLLVALNKTVAGIVDAYRNRERRVYEREPEPERPARTAPPPKTTARGARQRRAIDIPLDGEQPPEIPESGAFEPRREPLYSSTPRVKTPDQIISEYAPADNMNAAPVEDAPERNEDVPEDIPLDIPFMERKKAAKLPRPSQRAAERTERAAEPERAPEPVPERRAAPEPKPKSEPEAFVPPDLSGDEATPPYSYPPLELLAAGSASPRADGAEEVRVNTERLEAAFRSFGISVKISHTTRGPSVTRYEAELEAGVKLSRLTGLADDIALALGASGVRIGAMPNKISTVGIEVPNKLVSKVFLRDIIESHEFRTAQSKLTFAIGKNISGEAVVGNIAKLPHMLVAGTTGSGKSVCLNSMILSILYKATPAEVRFIMIDPKMVEFRVYNGIPHLLVPVVTDVKKAAGALQWAVVEMMKRYRMFSETNARDLESYNTVARASDELEPLPQVVVVIDELADLMMTAAKEVEESICRVAQMGRAAGVHLVIATQSPRADVITGLMKANIPSRIALKVSSALESRIILDAGGAADKLVGNGDMLYAPIGSTKPVRVQGTWVTDEERESVVEHIKQGGETQYSEEVMGEIERAAEEKSSGGKNQADGESATDHDELLPQAVDVIFETGQASASMLQRRLKLGYSRAARIIDQMEALGILGPFEGSKPRQVLVNRAQWHQMQYGSGVAPVDTYVGEAEIHSEEIDDGDAPF